jgi:hypothetical protein
MGQKDQYMEFGKSIGVSHDIGKQIKMPVKMGEKVKVTKTRPSTGLGAVASNLSLITK